MLKIENHKNLLGTKLYGSGKSGKLISDMYLLYIYNI